MQPNHLSFLEAFSFARLASARTAVLRDHRTQFVLSLKQICYNSLFNKKLQLSLADQRFIRRHKLLLQKLISRHICIPDKCKLVMRNCDTVRQLIKIFLGRKLH